MLSKERRRVSSLSVALMMNMVATADDKAELGGLRAGEVVVACGLVGMYIVGRTKQGVGVRYKGEI